MDKISVGVVFALSPNELSELVRDAIRGGYQRSNPKKPWTEDENKQAARFALTRMVHADLRNTKAPAGEVDG